MMEDSRWSVESVTKQVVNPSLTCYVVQLNCREVVRECLIYHLCRNHRALHLGAWEEVGNQEVAARLSQLAGLFTWVVSVDHTFWRKMRRIKLFSPRFASARWKVRNWVCLVCLGVRSKFVWQKGGGAKNFVYLPLQCLNAHVDILESSAHKKHKAA